MIMKPVIQCDSNPLIFHIVAGQVPDPFYYDIMEWFITNLVPHEIVRQGVTKPKIDLASLDCTLVTSVIFKNKEDAMAFKLRFL